MARSYCTEATCTPAAAGVTNAILNVVATALVQPSIYEINSGSGATADNAMSMILGQITAVGTGQGALTPFQINQVGGTAIAAITIFNQGASALDTYVSTKAFHFWSQHQRTAYRWVASSPQRMLMLPSTASNGAGFLPSVITAVYSMTLGVNHEE